MPITSKTTRSIRFRLIVAFTLLAVMAMLAALYAWRSASNTGNRVEELAKTVLPLVRLSNELSNDVGRFAMTTGKLSQVDSEKELETLNTELRQSSSTITSKISILYNYIFETERISTIHRKVDQLFTNLDQQYRLTQNKLGTQRQLQEALDDLTASQERFLQFARPRISEGYSNFLQEGREINQDIRATIGSYASGQEKPDLKKLDDKLRIGFETLINTSAGEMRANLEIVAMTFLSSGLLHEAANLESIEEIDKLERQFDVNTPFIAKIKLILSHSTPENYRVLLLASPILDAGSGEESIFSLRREELVLRNLLDQQSLEAITLSEQLARDVEYLSSSIEEYTDSSVSTLQQRLHRFRLYSAVSAIVTVFIVIVIGLFYVDRSVVRRIAALRVLMEQQAEGTDAHIPEDRHGDEISAMTKSLEHFVRQREERRHQLQKALLSLDEAQHLAKIGHCERNHLTKKWFWSSGFYNILGYSPEQFPSSEKNFWKIVHPKDRLKVELFFNTLSSPSRPSPIEFQLIGKDSETVTVTGLWKLTEDDRTYTQHGTLQDITDRKRIEEDLLKMRKMESISVLAGGIAHDFNNLLTGVLGNIALVIKIAQDRPEIVEHLKLSEKAALRARDLTKKLLVFSGGGAPTTNIVHLPEKLKETTEFALSGSNVKALFFMDDPLWPLDIDTTHLGQVLQNLVVNANQAMPDGGTVHISCKNRDFSGSHHPHLPAGKYVEITVTDSGLGIDPEHIDKIFDPYYTTKGFYSEKGSGLGLAIVHSIVTKNGGNIEVNSTLGSGTTFTLHLPAMPGHQPKPAVTTEKPDQSGSGFILVMDDEEVVREVAEQMLTRLGYTVDTVEDGAQLLEKYDETVRSGKMVDAVIMDLTIPGGMGGKETIHKLLEQHPSARVLVSSGYSSDPVIENYRLFGFSGIIIKPYQLQELAEVVARVVGGKERPDPLC